MAEPLGSLLVVSGPSGAGKSTIVRGLLVEHPFVFSVSVTTRAPRPSEVDGIHYRFVSQDEFAGMIERSELLEWAQYGVDLYGTPRTGVIERLEAGHDVLLEIEIQGARQVRAVHPSAVLVFVAPPSMAELERRLRGRGDTDAESIARRLAIAQSELTEAPEVFDIIVVNDDVDSAVTDILSALRAPRTHSFG